MTTNSTTNVASNQQPEPCTCICHLLIASCVRCNGNPCRASIGERDADRLATAIAEAAVKAGIIDGMSSLTGPQLVMLCDDLANSARVSAGGVVATVDRSKIVCLCGSTRFYKEFQRANYEETMAGNIVLSVGFYMHASEDAHGEKWGCTPAQKIALDALHFRKIELADEVLVINVGGYVGESTRNEINHAMSLGKVIRYLEPNLVPTASPAAPKEEK